MEREYTYYYSNTQNLILYFQFISIDICFNWFRWKMNVWINEWMDRFWMDNSYQQSNMIVILYTFIIGLQARFLLTMMIMGFFSIRFFLKILFLGLYQCDNTGWYIIMFYIFLVWSIIIMMIILCWWFSNKKKQTTFILDNIFDNVGVDDDVEDDDDDEFNIHVKMMMMNPGLPKKCVCVSINTCQI